MAQVQAAGQDAVDIYGRIDVIVNNAGVMPLAFFADHERAWQKWHNAIDINIKGVVNGISAVYDTMIKQRRGQVVSPTTRAGAWPLSAEQTQKHPFRPENGCFCVCSRPGR